jgi:hypothetical protein
MAWVGVARRDNGPSSSAGREQARFFEYRLSFSPPSQARPPRRPHHRFRSGGDPKSIHELFQQGVVTRIREKSRAHGGLSLRGNQSIVNPTSKSSVFKLSSNYYGNEIHSAKGGQPAPNGPSIPTQNRLVREEQTPFDDGGVRITADRSKRIGPAQSSRRRGSRG